ncbi:hypothetical protein VNO77_44269 [Canavalia gladiata]|uniref:Uncharacterized protein n=1 Tax=Canavalia gladiata TaxID=3824 RepID=A0AAN9JYM3_CANGL
MNPWNAQAGPCTLDRKLLLLLHRLIPLRRRDSGFPFARHLDPLKARLRAPIMECLWSDRASFELGVRFKPLGQCFNDPC